MFRPLVDMLAVEVEDHLGSRCPNIAATAPAEAPLSKRSVAKEWRAA
jgi:hypothetical protein